MTVTVLILAASCSMNLVLLVWVVHVVTANQGLHNEIARVSMQLRELTERLARQEKVRQADLTARYEPLLTRTPAPGTIQAALSEPDTWKKP